MGADHSKELREEKLVENKCVSDFLQKHMPDFIQSEYCVTGTGEWTNTITFLLAFLSYVNAKHLDTPRWFKSNSEYMKYYFNVLNTDKNMYVTGSCSMNVLVGVSLRKWPGTRDTDNRAPLQSQLPRLPVSL